MPAKQKFPHVKIALAPASLAAAFDIQPRHIYRAIAEGHLELRTLPGTMARRIWVGDAEQWYRNVWLKAAPRSNKRKVSTNAG